MPALHTPPPWIIGDNLRFVSTNKQSPIAETFEQPRHPASGDALREQRANAKLIAQAPIMLDTLKRIAGLTNPSVLAMKPEEYKRLCDRIHELSTHAYYTAVTL